MHRPLAAAHVAFPPRRPSSHTTHSVFPPFNHSAHLFFPRTEPVVGETLPPAPAPSVPSDPEDEGLAYVPELIPKEAGAPVFPVNPEDFSVCGMDYDHVPMTGPAEAEVRVCGCACARECFVMSLKV